MSFWKRLFHREPAHNCAIYLDRDKNGKYSARLVRGDDGLLGERRPTTVWMSSVRDRTDNFVAAANGARGRLHRLGFDPDMVNSIPCWRETDDGKVVRV